MSEPVVPVTAPFTASGIANWIRLVTGTLNRLIRTAATSGGTAAWGGITGTLSAQTDLQTALNAKQASDATLTALAAYNTNGFLVQTAADTFTGRTITSGSAKITIGNGNGVGANPTVDLGSVSSTDLSNSADIARFSIGGTFAVDIIVPDEAYDATAWNGSLEVPTKNAIRDKIETLGGGGTVTTTGSPASGNLAAFSGATSITNGNLSGDVTTSGALATTIANDAVTYAKMQNVSAASRLLGRGSAAGSGDTEEISLGVGLAMSGTTLSSGTWALAGTGQTATGVYDFAVDGAKLNIDFVGLASFNELLVVARGLTDGTSGQRALYVSVDNGASFFTTSGNYKNVTFDGVEVNSTAFAFHDTASTAARSFAAHVLNTKGAVKICHCSVATVGQHIFDASASDINAIRIANAGGGNITGGTVRVYAR